jgi:cytochrome c553
MKKPTYLCLVALVVASMVLLAAGQSQAITSKKCFNCHTMHNSQSNASMLLTYRDDDPLTDTVDGDPQGALIRYTTCAGCHINGAGAATIVADTPIVFNVTGYPADALAGGNFYPASIAADLNKAHNCAGVTTQTDIAPPGFVATTTDPSRQVPDAYATASGYTGTWGPTSDWIAGTQVTCAGEYGCHGDRRPGYDEFAAIRGSHHTNGTLDTTQVCDGTTTPLSYRFLAGIKGAEQNNGILDSYEFAAAATKHNGYYGRDSVDRADADITATISFLCAECHGNFHNAGAAGSSAGIGTGSPWLRHPTDIAFSSAVGDEFDAYTTYDPLVPVGWTSNVATNTTGMPADPVVVCVSCHRAHGSDNDDLLRWQYSPADWGGTLGDQPATHSCRTCHTAK